MAQSAADVLSGTASPSNGGQQDSQDISPIDVYKSLITGLQPQIQQAVQAPQQQVPGMDQGAVQVQPQPAKSMLGRILQGALLGMAAGGAADPQGQNMPGAFAQGFQTSLGQRQLAVNEQNKAFLAARDENRAQGVFQQKMTEAQQNNIIGRIGMAKAMLESSFFPDALQQTMEKPITDWTSKVTENGLMQIDSQFADYDSLHKAIFDASKAGKAEYPGRLPNGQYVMMSPTKAGYSSQDVADTVEALGLGDPSQVAQLRKQNLTYTSDTFGKILAAAGQKYSADHKSVNEHLQGQLLQEKIDNERLQNHLLQSNGQPDAFGDTTTSLPAKIAEQRQRSWYTQYGKDLTNVESTFNMAESAYNDYLAAKAQGKVLPSGAQSMLLLSQHLGTTFGNVKGSRVTKDMIKEHLGARSVSDDAVVAIQRLTNGDVLSPSQWDAFHNLIGQSYAEKYVSANNAAQNMGLPRTYLPRGNGRVLDPFDGSIFLRLAGGDVQKAYSTAQKYGWR